MYAHIHTHTGHEIRKRIAQMSVSRVKKGLWALRWTSWMQRQEHKEV